MLHRLRAVRAAAVPAAAVLAAALCVLHAAPPARAGGDSLSVAARTARKSFKRAGKDADRTFRDAAAILQRGLASGTTSSEQAATGFGDALAFYAASLKTAADDAAAAFAADAGARMELTGDDALPGAVAGDGGSYDLVAESLAADLSRFRARAQKRVDRFRRALERDGGPRVEMRVRLETWSVSPRPVPRIGAPFTTWDEPLRLWGVALTRLPDGRVAYSVFGSAAPALDDRFDVRLHGTLVRALGDFLADGGMDVLPDGTWRRTGTIGDPFAGDGVESGPRQVVFGVEPEDQGLAGLQPKRHEHAGAISVP